MLTRRAFARTLVLGAAGLLVPAPLAALANEPARRLWALDGSMLGAGPRSPYILSTADLARLGLPADPWRGVNEFRAYRRRLAA